MSRRAPCACPLRARNDGAPPVSNCIAANDHVALVHTDIDRETEDIIADVLGVEVWSVRTRYLSRLPLI